MADLLPLPPSGVQIFDVQTGYLTIQGQNYFNALNAFIAAIAGAPNDATYWVSSANGSLTNESNLGALLTGYLKVTVAAGFATPSSTPSIPGSDVAGAALTKTDDTNVLLTLGGTPATALLHAVSLTLGWSGTLARARGGTGLAVAGTAGHVLTSDGTDWVSAAPVPSTVWVACHNSTTQTLSDNTETAVTFDTNDFDSGSLHSTSSNTSRITVPTTGKYYLSAGIFFAAGSTGRRYLYFRKNGSTTISTAMIVPPDGSNYASADGPALHRSALVALTAADYVEVIAYQNNGGSLTIGDASSRLLQSEFSAVQLG